MICPMKYSLVERGRNFAKSILQANDHCRKSITSWFGAKRALVARVIIEAVDAFFMSCARVFVGWVAVLVRMFPLVLIDWVVLIMASVVDGNRMLEMNSYIGRKLFSDNICIYKCSYRLLIHQYFRFVYNLKNLFCTIVHC